MYTIAQPEVSKQFALIKLYVLKFSVATYLRQFDEKRKPALLRKPRYSSVAIRYKVAGNVEETVGKISAFVGSRLIGRARVGSSLLWDSIKKSHDCVVSSTTMCR